MNDKISINQMPKWFKGIIIFLPVLGVMVIPFALNNDFYFLYPMGEYIVSNGFPTKDILSMHSSMDIIIQQWLSDVIFYCIYRFTGTIGVYILCCLCYLLMCYFIFKTSYLVGGNFFVSAVLSFVADAHMACLFIMSRPQIFSLLFLIIEIYCLEKYVKEKKALYLAAIPILSLLTINFHSSVWLMIIVFMLPYFAQSIPLKIGKLQQESCCSFKSLFVTAALSVGTAFINPYGIKAMSYGISSMFHEELKHTIYEMRSPKFTDSTGRMFYILLAGVIIFSALYCKKGKRETRFFFLLAGCTIMALMSVRSISFFLIALAPAMSGYFSNLDIKVKINTKSDKKTKRLRYVLIILIISCIVGIIPLSNNSARTKSEETKYDSIQCVVDILDKDPTAKDKNIYSSMEWGPYLEFCGYHPFIDCRAELFLDANNHEYNYIREFYNVYSGKLSYSEFISRYDFDYLVISDEEENMLNGAMKDSDYQLIKTTEFETIHNFYLFSHKDKN